MNIHITAASVNFSLLQNLMQTKYNTRGVHHPKSGIEITRNSLPLSGLSSPAQLLDSITPLGLFSIFKGEVMLMVDF